jgi:hypothetical protein
MQQNATSPKPSKARLGQRNTGGFAWLAGEASVGSTGSRLRPAPTVASTPRPDKTSRLVPKSIPNRAPKAPAPAPSMPPKLKAA